MRALRFAGRILPLLFTIVMLAPVYVLGFLLLFWRLGQGAAIEMERYIRSERWK